MRHHHHHLLLLLCPGLVGCGPPEAPPAGPVVTRLREENAALRQQLREAQLLLRMAEGSGVQTALFVTYPPAIDGRVLDADRTARQTWVRLDVGADDKLEVGYQLSLYRGSQFVGKVVVEAVRRDDATARVLFLAEGRRIEPGDQAATRLQ